MTPTGPVRRTQIRAVALLAPLAAGALVLLAAAVRGQALAWASAGLALAGNVLLGFAAACVVRTRTGEPGAAAGTAVVLVLMAPSPRAAGRALGPHVPGARRRRAIPGHRVVDRPGGMRGGHRRLGQWSKAAPVEVQGSMIPVEGHSRDAALLTPTGASPICSPS